MYVELLKREFEHYLKNQDDLVKKYNGKYIVIKDLTVIGVYDDELSEKHRSPTKWGHFSYKNVNLG